MQRQSGGGAIQSPGPYTFILIISRRPWRTYRQGAMTGEDEGMFPLVPFTIW